MSGSDSTKVDIIMVLMLVFYFNQGGPPPALIKAEVPWSAHRGTLSEKERVLKTVKG